MGDGTSIEWTDASWPVINGCRRVSPGCENCYAERLMATRLRHMPKYIGLAEMKKSGPRFTGRTRLWEPHLDWPLRWKKPRKIFVADMSDLFFEEVTNEEIAAIFGIMAACPHHTFQVLTKRAERMREWFRWIDKMYAYASDARPWKVSTCFRAAQALGVDIEEPRHGVKWPLPNVHLGVSVEDQPRADERLPLLVDTPAVLHWVSLEPLLDDTDVTPWLRPQHNACQTDAQDERSRQAIANVVRAAGETLGARYLDWGVVGLESGPRARPGCISWVGNVVHDFNEAGVPIFVKQLGRRPYETTDDAPLPFERVDFAWPEKSLIKLRHKKGADPSEWPEHLRVQEFPR